MANWTAIMPVQTVLPGHSTRVSSRHYARGEPCPSTKGINQRLTADPYRNVPEKGKNNVGTNIWDIQPPCGKQELCRSKVNIDLPPPPLSSGDMPSMPQGQNSIFSLHGRSCPKIRCKTPHSNRGPRQVLTYTLTARPVSGMGLPGEGGTTAELSKQKFRDERRRLEMRVLERLVRPRRRRAKGRMPSMRARPYVHSGPKNTVPPSHVPAQLTEHHLHELRVHERQQRHL
jgi:hypothetical protein